MKITFKDKTSVEIINNELREFDTNNNCIHYKDSDGYESWYEYDANNNLIHYKDSTGSEYWYDSKGNKISKLEFDKLNSNCNGKEVIIDGKKYQLTLIK